MGAVFHRLAPPDEGLDLGARLEGLEKHRGIACRFLFRDVLDGDDQAQAQALAVGVQEAAPEEALGDVPREEVRRPLAVAHAEAVVDPVAVELNHLLDADGVVLRASRAAQAGFLRDEGENPVAGDDRVRPQLFAPGDNAADPAVITHQVRHEGLGEYHAAALLDALGEPAVEFRSEDAVALGLFGPQFAAGVVEGEGAVAGHEGGPLADDGPLEGRLLPEAREEIADGVQIDAAAGDVLGAGVVAALQDDDLDPLAGQRPGRRKARQSRPHHDDVKLFHECPNVKPVSCDFDAMSGKPPCFGFTEAKTPCQRPLFEQNPGFSMQR
ncbi:MAG: hypothetical protein A4E73_00557 [Syntrophaceae bacterium PtaU1.Bin231]|nr:MAG: hypothetical protein A4E73_00557 [Syntrophaceae bacterium PtaU1.Bin231]